MFTVGIASWFLLKKRETRFALASIKVGAIFGLITSLLTLWTGDGSGYQVAQKQPMKLAAMEGLYEGGQGVSLVGIGILNPQKKSYDDGINPFLFKISFPNVLSLLADRSMDGFVPGITQLMEGGYETKDGTKALSAQEKIAKGQIAIKALADYRQAVKDKDEITASQHKKLLEENFSYFGYGYIQDPSDLIPHIGLTFYSFHIMVILGSFFILLFALTSFLSYKNKFVSQKWLQWVCLLSIPLAYIAGQAGWIVAEVGRQPWAIQDILPTAAAVSRLQTSSVQITFFVFLTIFTLLLIAEIGIMIKVIKQGPESGKDMSNELH